VVILNTGGTEIRDVVADMLLTGEYGSDGTTESPADSGLGTPISSTAKSLAITKSGLTILTSHDLISTEGNGNTLREFALQNSSSDITRTTTTELVKDNTKEVVTTSIMFVSIN